MTIGKRKSYKDWIIFFTKDTKDTKSIRFHSKLNHSAYLFSCP